MMRRSTRADPCGGEYYVFCFGSGGERYEWHCCGNGGCGECLYRGRC